MKILFATLGYKPAWRLGGPVLSVSALAESLVRRGHEVTVLTTDSNLNQSLDVATDRMLEIDGVRVRYFRRQPLVPQRTPRVAYLSKSVGYLYAPEMRAELDRLVPTMDLVHTHLPFIYPTLAAGRAALRHGKPLFYHQRGVFDPARLRFRSFKKTLYLRLFEQPLLQAAQVLFALTEAEGASYERLGVKTPIRVVPNGIAAEAYASPANWQDLHALGIRDDDRIVLFMGRLHPVKGADRLLRAFFAIADRMPSARLVLAGPDEFGIEDRFRAHVADAGLADRVIFTGMLSGSRKLSLLRRADLFCLPSDAEGFSMAVLEAMASGCAVLLSPGCHFPEVETAGAGRISSHDPDVLASHLVELLSSPEELKRMGEAGERLVTEHYSWDGVADKTIRVYEDGIRLHTEGRRHP